MAVDGFLSPQGLHEAAILGARPGVHRHTDQRTNICSSPNVHLAHTAEMCHGYVRHRAHGPSSLPVASPQEQMPVSQPPPQPACQFLEGKAGSAVSGAGPEEAPRHSHSLHRHKLVSGKTAATPTVYTACQLADSGSSTCHLFGLPILAWELYE